MEKFFEETQEVILSFCFLFALDVPNSSRHLLFLYLCVCVSVCLWVCGSVSSGTCLPWFLEFPVYFQYFPQTELFLAHTIQYRQFGHMCVSGGLGYCVCVPQFVWSLFWVGQCLLLALPLIVSGSSDCRLYFRLSRNVLLTILVLTDWLKLLPFWPFAKWLCIEILCLVFFFFRDTDWSFDAAESRQMQHRSVTNFTYVSLSASHL